jgi:hypothetical protein
MKTIEKMTVIEFPEDLSFIPQENVRGLLKIALKEIRNHLYLYDLFIDENVIVDYKNDAFDPILLSLEHKCENIIKNDVDFNRTVKSTYNSILAMVECIIIDGFETFKANYDNFYGQSLVTIDHLESDDSDDDSEY